MSAVLEEKKTRGLREIVVLACIVVALFFLTSLITFSNDDAGWTHSGVSQTVLNAGGVMGAWLADFSLSFLGVCAYLLPLLLLWGGYGLYISNQANSGKVWFALIGVLATLVSSSALLNLYVLRTGMELPHRTGGILGQEVGDKLLFLFGNSGATLFLAALLLAGFSLVTEMSWIHLVNAIGHLAVAAFRFIGHSVSHLFYQPPAKPRFASTGPEHVDLPMGSTDVASRSWTGSTPKKPLTTVKTTNLAKKHPPQSAVAQHLTDGALPSLEFLDQRENHVSGYTEEDLHAMSRRVEEILADFNVAVAVVGFHPGPVITRFDLQPSAGVKVSRISSLSKDLARALLVTSVRIVEIVPGKSVVGLEIPNRQREMVNLRDLLASENFYNAKSLLTLAMGKDIAGMPLVADLGKMPHVLVAGTTGSGKSVAINTMILSLLYKATPEQVRLIMIDPKMLELSVYEDIPHLLTPVVTDMKEASNALRWAVGEMERRYKLMSKMGVRNLAGFNQLIKDAAARDEAIRDPVFQIMNPLETGDAIPVLTTLPSIVIVIDELADMMMIVGKKVEELIARLAQKARAAGIHLILATQRPSVDVLTGLIKANVPTRISFQVSSRIDSRTILDQGGAETLLGNGDMLFLPSGTSIPIRAHGAFVDDHEVHRVVEFLKQTAPANYLDEITQDISENNDGFGYGGNSGNNNTSENDALYDEAVLFVTDNRKASISSVQRRFKIGYNRAASIIESMEAAGVVSAAESNGSRVVLAPPPIKD